MSQKDRSVRRVDETNPALITGGGQLIQAGTAPVATPSFPSAPPPQNVTVSSGQALLRTTYTPKVLVAISWDAPVNLQPELYSIESAENVNFTTNLQRWSTVLTSGVIDLKPNTDYWIRVQAVVRGVYGEYGYPDNYPVAAVHTINDTTPPGPVTGVATNWNTGDLRWTWTNPTSDNFFQTRIRIYDTFGGTLYVEDYIVGNPGSISSYVFTVAMNNRATGNNPLTTVYYELLAYSLAGVPSATTVTGTVTKAKPAVPTGLANTWTSDDGTFDEGVTISWNAVTGASEYRLIIDGVTKQTPRTLYTYNYTENVSDHRPTLVSGDFSLSYTLQAIDPLGQVGGGASGTATNLAPVSSNLNLSYVPGFSSLYAFATPTTEIKDLFGYRWTLKSGGITVQTTLSFTPEVTFTTLYGVYALELYAIDLFGRRSNAISGVNIVLDGLTIDQLRSETKYTNSIGTNPTTLDGLKDNNLLTSVVTIASGTAWKWTKAERPLLDRYHSVTFAVSGAATNWPVVYFGVSTDDTTYRWFSGPLAGNFGITLTEHATETIAQASGVLLASNINRFDLPVIVEGRFVKAGHRGNIHNMTEYYPRRIIQSDDIEAESIKAINIAAATITADRIAVFSLTAAMATISGVLTIGTQGGIWQGTGTFASPITGLKVYNSGGIGRIALYSGGIVQVESTSNGILTAGAGAVQLTASGVSLFSLKSASEAVTSKPFYQVRWLDRDITSRVIAGIYGELAIGLQDTHILNLYSSAPSSSFDSIVQIYADSNNNGILGGAPYIAITNLSNLSTRTIDLVAANKITFDTSQMFMQEPGGSLKFLRLDNTAAAGDTMISLENSGDDIGAGSYWIRAQRGSEDRFYVLGDGKTAAFAADSATNASISALTIAHRTTGTPAAGFGVQMDFSLDSTTAARLAGSVFVDWTSATDSSRTGNLRLRAHDNAGTREFFRGHANGSAAQISFFGGGTAAKQTVTGVRTGTLAQLQTVVANMLTALANYGLWTDSTT